MQPWLCPASNNIPSLLFSSLIQNGIIFMIIFLTKLYNFNNFRIIMAFQEAEILHGYSSGWKQYFSQCLSLIA